MNLKPTPPAPGQKIPYTVLASMIRTLMKGPRTAKQLARDTGVSDTAARNFLRALHAARCIHVCDYARTRRYSLGARVYAFGNEPDLSRPPRMTNAERQQRYRQRHATLEGAWR